MLSPAISRNENPLPPLLLLSRIPLERPENRLHSRYHFSEFWPCPANDSSHHFRKWSDVFYIRIPDRIYRTGYWKTAVPPKGFLHWAGRQYILWQYLQAGIEPTQVRIHQQGKPSRGISKRCRIVLHTQLGAPIIVQETQDRISIAILISIKRTTHTLKRKIAKKHDQNTVCLNRILILKRYRGMKPDFFC